MLSTCIFTCLVKMSFLRSQQSSQSPQIVGVVVMLRKILKQMEQSNSKTRESICRTHVKRNIKELVGIRVTFHTQ